MNRCFVNYRKKNSKLRIRDGAIKKLFVIKGTEMNEVGESSLHTLIVVWIHSHTTIYPSYPRARCY